MDPRIRIRIHPKMSWIRNTGVGIQPPLIEEVQRREKSRKSALNTVWRTLYSTYFVYASLSSTLTISLPLKTSFSFSLPLTPFFLKQRH
jgi:hypothetical protein